MGLVKNALTIALRNIRRNRIYSAISIFGLAVGLAGCLMMMLFVRHELSYDRFHTDVDRIWRVAQETLSAGRTYRSAKTPTWIAPQSLLDIPEVENAVRILPLGSVVSAGDLEFNEVPYFVDPSFFEIFTFPFVKGDMQTALRAPHEIVISEDFAAKGFGRTDPLGETLMINGRHPFTVTGVVENVPSNAHFRFDLLCSFDRLKEMFLEEHEYNRGYTYVLLRDLTASADLESKIQAMAAKAQGEMRAARYRYFLQPLTSIYLQSDLRLEIGKTSHIRYSYFLSGLALLILIIAGMNFVNLSTARAARRAKEVGVRKATGANRRNLIVQFLGESVLFAVLSLLLAVLLAQLTLPLFNNLSERSLELTLAGNGGLLLGALFLTLATGIMAGIYPALVLASFSPVDVFRGRASDARKDKWGLRKVLLVAQFAVSIAFVVSTGTVFRQLVFMESKDLGFSPRDIVYFWPSYGSTMNEKYLPLKTEILAYPSVRDVTGSSSNTPGTYPGFERVVKVDGNPDKTANLFASAVDANFFAFFGISLKEGRSFEDGDSVNPGGALVVNKAAAELLGEGSPLGRRLDEEMMGIHGNVVGVVEDFHNVSLYEDIKPAVYYFDPGETTGLFVLVEGRERQAAIDAVRRTYSSFFPEFPVYFTFLEDQIDGHYSEERRAFQVFRSAFVLSLVIAGLGLLGLVSFTVERRTKEIGIRKVLGASLARIIRLLTQEYVGLIAVASVLAWPLSYYFMNRWLENFAYRIGIGAGIFLLSSSIAFCAAFLVMAFPALRAARANPVDSLRDE